MRDEGSANLPAWLSKTWEIIHRFRQLEGSTADTRLCDRRTVLAVVLAIGSCAMLRWLWPADELGGVRGFCYILVTIAWIYRLMFVKNNAKKTINGSASGKEIVNETSEKSGKTPRRKVTVPAPLGESISDVPSVPSLPTA